MAAERQSPDVIIEQTKISGALSSIQDDPDTPDANWWVADQNGATASRVGFPTSTGNPTVGAGLQEFKVQVRKVGGSNSVDIDIELWETGGGARLAFASVTGITSTTGVLHSLSWNANLLATADGSAVECRVVQTGGHTGSPASKAYLEVGAVEWNVTYDSATIVDADGSSTGVASSSITASWIFAGASSAVGVAASSIIGAAFWLTVASSTGVGAASGDPSAFHLVNASSTAAASVSGDAAYVTGGDHSSVGIATASATTANVLGGTGDSTGLGTPSGVGSLTALGDGASSGSSTVTADGQNASSAVDGSSSGSSTVTGDGVSVLLTDYSGTGTGAALGDAATLILGDGSSSGQAASSVATTTFITTTGTTAGTTSADAPSAQITSGDMSTVGLAAATGVGENAGTGATVQVGHMTIALGGISIFAQGAKNIKSAPTTGHFKVSNIFVDSATGKTVVEYSDTPQ